MNIEQAKQEIINSVKIYTAKDENGAYRIPSVHQRPVLLIGPPGIGKTAIIRQAADICNIGLVAYTITHHTRQSAVGLPVVAKKEYGGREVAVTEYTMSEIVASVYECIEQTGHEEGILFIDEINCVSETLTPTMLQFLQNKTFGTHSIPKGWVIVAAGNPTEYNKSAKMFDVVTMDRVKYIPVDIDFQVWKSYAIKKGLHSAIISYLSSKPQNFYYVEEARGDREFVTARGWEDLSVLLLSYEREGIQVSSHVIAEYLHCRKIALDFSAYYLMFAGFQKDYRMAEILDGTADQGDVSKQQELLAKAGPDERYSVIQLMLSNLYDRFGAYSQTVSCDERKAEVFASLKDFGRRNEDLRADSVLETFLADFDKALQVKRDHHILSDDLLHIEDQVLTYFGKCRYQVKEARIDNMGEAVTKIAGFLQADEARKEKMAVAIMENLERAFIFLEGVKSAGDTLGYFMTALSLNDDACAFLNDYNCAGYKRNLKYLETANDREELKRHIAGALAAQ